MLLYITVLLKPLLPVVEDLWAHAFYEVKHLSHVHGKYGSHHLQNELANASSEDHNTNQNTLKSEDQVSLHVLPAVCKAGINIVQTDKNYPNSLPGKQPFILIALQGPPPKFS